MFSRNIRRNAAMTAAAILATLSLTGAASASLPDMNSDGAVGLDDLSSYMSSFFNKDKAADTNGDGTVSVQDLFDFIAKWVSGRTASPSPEKPGTTIQPTGKIELETHVN